jgi:very-short-patch-repair endonuclease
VAARPDEGAQNSRQKEKNMTNGSPSRRDGEPVYSLEYRRKLRATQTKAESVVWAMVRNRRLGGFKFRRQFSIEHLIVDFICLERHLVVELDGDYHDMTIEKDIQRDQFLAERGFRVFRIPNEEVFQDADAVARGILKVLNAPAP